MVLVVYDITDSKRLRKVSKLLEKYGLRAQNSTFELEEENYGEIINKLKKLINEEEEDKIFIFKISDKKDYKKELAKKRRLWDFVV